MQQAIPEYDVQALQRLRAEAKLYLPTTDQAYRASIEDGTDPYTGRWFGVAMNALAFYCVAYVFAETLV